MHDKITSNKNQKIKDVSNLQRSKKERTERGMFVAEGLRIFRDAVQSAPDAISEIYVSESFLASVAGTPDEKLFADRDHTIVSDSVFTAMCETVTPQGVMAVVRQPSYSYEDIVGAGKLKLLILEDIQDPGNLGTMVRTAEAAGMSGIIMSRGTVDMFSPKVTRSTMGAVFRVPFMYTDDLCATLDSLQADGVSIYGAYLHGGEPFKSISYAERAAVMIGNEGNGLSDDAIAHATHRVFIPMAGQVESLNASVAAALMMYEL